MIVHVRDVEEAEVAFVTVPIVNIMAVVAVSVVNALAVLTMKAEAHGLVVLANIAVVLLTSPLLSMTKSMKK